MVQVASFTSASPDGFHDSGALGREKAPTGPNFELYHCTFGCTKCGYFRVALNLIMIQVRLGAKFLLGKLVFIQMQTKLIFI